MTKHNKPVSAATRRLVTRLARLLIELGVLVGYCATIAAASAAAVFGILIAAKLAGLL